MAARCPQPGALGRPGEGGRGREHCPREGAWPRRRGAARGPLHVRPGVTGTPGACSPLPASVQLKPRPDFAFRTILSLTFRTRKVISGSSPVLPLGALSPSSTPPSLPRAAPGEGGGSSEGPDVWAGQRPSAEQAAREPRQHSGLPAPGSAAQTVPHEHPGRVCADICATPNYAPSGGLARALNSDPEPKEHLGN